MKMKTSDKTMQLQKKSREPVSDKQLEYVRKIKRNRILIRIYQLLIFTGFLLIWEYTARHGIINDFIFCSPSKLFVTLVTMLKDGSLLHHIGITLYETLVSFVIVIAGSLIIATLFWWNKTLSRVMEPYLVILNALPKSALAPVLIVWLGANLKVRLFLLKY